MKTYLVVRRQGGGCDYTIGCGISVGSFQAESMEAAERKIVDLDDDWKKQAKEAEDPLYYLDLCIRESSIFDVDPRNDCSECEEVSLYEISDSLDMVPILKEKLADINGFKKELEAEATQARDLKEFERLKKKLRK